MAEEIDDNGFYREDFTANSEWEVFNAQLCDLFQKWKLSSTQWGNVLDISKCQWQKEEEQLEVLGKSITVLYYKAQMDLKEETSAEEAAVPPFHEDLMCLANTSGPTWLDDKPNEAPYLSRMYGLRRFVVMHPTQLKNKYLTKTSKFNFFLSSISVVAAEVCSAVPIFVQIYDPKWQFYLGVGMSAYMRTNFDLVALEQAPQEYLYLSGLVKMFKEKLPRSYGQPAVVSIRNIYNLDTIKLRIPMYVPFGMTPLVDEQRSVIACSQFTALPHGYFPGSNTDMYAEFLWPELTDNMFIDSYMQTQFVPSKAPCGSLYQDVHANSYLTACVKDFFNLITATNTLESYLGQNFAGSIGRGEINPLNQLSQSHSKSKKSSSHRQSKEQFGAAPQIHNFHIEPTKKLSGPINEYELKQMLGYLFPELHPDVALFPYESLGDDKIDPHRIKSAEPDSLVHRLSCLLATCHAHFGGKSGLAQLYAAFTRQLRLLWDCAVPIPAVTPGYPDARTCLLHQKLQLLNVCIYRRMQRGIDVNAKKDMQNITDDEEFYDFSDDEDASDKKQGKNYSQPKIYSKPQGRLKRLGNLKLLKSNDPLYIPVTQEIVPKTEDQLQGDADNVLKMGSDSEIITDMMCSTVVSDSEAFKAANPNACFEDFIRWFSPNDWEEYMDEELDVKKYRLSARMRAPGNTWQTVWEQAKPVPVSRQKRLFDDTQEGFKIIKYLESRNLGEIFALTVVPLLQSSILKLQNIFSNCNVLELFVDSLNDILAELSRFSRDVELVQVASSNELEGTKYALQLPDPQPILEKIQQIEAQFYQYNCFLELKGIKEIDAKKIHEKFREILRNNGSCSITKRAGNTSDFSLQSLSIFQEAMHDKVISKDYVIRMGEGLVPPRHALHERDEEKQHTPIMPQFLRAIVTGEKLRLCGAFTEHTTFLD